MFSSNQRRELARLNAVSDFYLGWWDRDWFGRCSWSRWEFKCFLSRTVNEFIIRVSLYFYRNTFWAAIHFKTCRFAAKALCIHQLPQGCAVAILLMHSSCWASSFPQPPSYWTPRFQAPQFQSWWCVRISRLPDLRVMTSTMDGGKYPTRSMPLWLSWMCPFQRPSTCCSKT